MVLEFLATPAGPGHNSHPARKGLAGVGTPLFSYSRQEVLVPGSFVRLCAAQEMADGQSRRFDVAGHRVALIRIGDDFYAIGDRCSHANVSLSDGDVLVDDCEIECHKHGSHFDLRTGKPLSLPASKPVPTYEVRIVGDDVLVDLG